jgi:hypothetical protein
VLGVPLRLCIIPLQFMYILLRAPVWGLRNAALCRTVSFVSVRPAILSMHRCFLVPTLSGCVINMVLLSFKPVYCRGCWSSNNKAEAGAWPIREAARC